MAIVTKYIYDRIYITDGWANEVIPVGGVVRNLADVIKLDEYMSFTVDGEDNITRFLNDTINLDEYMGYTLGDGLTQYLNDVISLDEYMSYEVALAGVVVRVYDNIDLDEEMLYEVMMAMSFKYNENISFGDTEEPNYKEYSHRFRWTNYNGVAVPDLNFKDLKEPIVRMIPAPSFLQFKYDNSFLLFCRNSINRFLLDADVETGQWRAQTDNLIEEFSDFGLMAPKTLVLAADTLFGLSEKGVWKWNKEGMRLISDKIIDLPDAGIYEYIAFYCPIRNQYILHRQESSGSVYIMTHGTAVDINGVVSGVSADQQVEYIGNDKVVTVSWGSNGSVGLTAYAMVGTINRITQSIVHGTQISLQPAGGLGGRGQPTVCKLTDNKVILCVDDSAAPARMYCYVGTIVGDTIILGTATTILVPVNFAWSLRAEKLNDTTFVLIHTYSAGAAYYNIGRVDGTTITFGAQQAMPHTYIEPVNTAIVETDKIALMYRAIGTSLSYVYVASYDGSDVLVMGTPVSLDAAYQIIALSCPTEVKLFMAIVDALGNLILQPAQIDGMIVTLGSTSTYTDMHQNTSPWIGLANKGTNGFFIFYIDRNNSDIGTAVYGAGSETSMQLFEDTKTVFSAAACKINISASIEGNMVLNNFAVGVPQDGFEQIWGLDFAAINSFVYQIDKDQWYKFLGIDILDVPVILSGGSLDENYNLWLDSDRELQKYPGTITTTIDAYIRTKEFYIQEGVFQRWLVDFEGTGVDVETRVIKEVGGYKVEEEDIKFSVAPNKFRGISLGKMRGRTMSVKIINAEIIKALLLDVKGWGER